MAGGSSIPTFSRMHTISDGTRPLAICVERDIQAHGSLSDPSVGSSAMREKVVTENSNAAALQYRDAYLHRRLQFCVVMFA